jgi:phospholipid/cholesterol/gamma-HCH transport system permease protein
LLAELLGAERLSHCTNDLPESSRALLKNVYCSVQDYCIPVKEPERNVLTVLLERIGCAVGAMWQDTMQLLGFLGLIIETLLLRLFQPHRWRVTPVVAHIEQTGLDAAPIVALLTFLVGAVVAFLGATVLANFGATVFTVDLVAFSFLREFAVLLTAILLAGRTASAFTAQIGSMKANEEIDAIRTLGLNPIELLVVPRVLALLISLPLLTFVAMVCGIVGGAVVCALSLGISPAMFLSLLQSDIGVQHFLVGLAKAPVFAFLIAAIGCLEGFKVSGSAESVGAHTTSSVVQSIFVVIVLDAVAALFCMEMGW